MIPSPEGFSNFMQGRFGVAPSQIHRHLARECNIRGAPFTGHMRHCESLPSSTPIAAEEIQPQWESHRSIRKTFLVPSYILNR